MAMSVAAPCKIRFIDGEVKETNHYSEKLHDNVLEAILKRTYDLFQVFTGGFTYHDHQQDTIRTVSYTHLTLPTIYSV